MQRIALGTGDTMQKRKLPPTYVRNSGRSPDHCATATFIASALANGACAIGLRVSTTTRVAPSSTVFDGNVVRSCELKETLKSVAPLFDEKHRAHLRSGSGKQLRHVSGYVIDHHCESVLAREREISDPYCQNGRSATA